MIRFAATLAVALLAAAPVTANDKDHAHDHDHSHDDDIYRGYFLNDQVKPRALSDWEGDWQSVYPLLTAGALDPVMAHKAEDGDKSAEEYRASYDIGYATDVDRITIQDGAVLFYRKNQVTSGQYADDGLEILTYEKGNRGVRFIFAKTAGDAAAPQFIQFSDHQIAPHKSHHFHLYWGDDRTQLLSELTNWPTYYPANLTGDQIVQEMLAH
ncbi:MAG: metal-binding protein ZinT [Paracoccus sp. (in: a-proteobacteria)]|uniref:ZinT family metal-binding protein n=1 Tax=Paracoccus sp. TaxID=267 RepID=UPI0026DF2F31|nr:metal-binding protein ZinT [Paracoccus sp. (in: a-proteobacteria)]MDO5621856.1 metal-binding protein ZinT [Paracoccus sp. (in: a-proteobacteria)]